MTTRAALCVSLLCLAACGSTPAPANSPTLPPNPTPVDLLLLRGEIHGITPATDLMRVRGGLPGLTGVETGIAEAGLLVSEDGYAIVSDRSGGRVAYIWLEFQGTRRVRATAMASADGRLKAGATEADLLAYLRERRAPLIVREFSAEETPGGVVVREYYVDGARAWAVVVNGQLSKIIAADNHVYGKGRRGAEYRE